MNGYGKCSVGQWWTAARLSPHIKGKEGKYDRKNYTKVNLTIVGGVHGRSFTGDVREKTEPLVRQVERCASWGCYFM